MLIKKNLNKFKKNKIKKIKKELKIQIKLNDKTQSLLLYKDLQKFLDRYSQKNVIKKNKSSRIKSLFIKKINSLL